MKLTAELILRSPENINPCKDRELNLREDFGTSCISLNTLILTNNRLVNLQDLDALAMLPSLKYLSLLDNIIDYKKVSQQERDESKELFGPSKSIKQPASASKTFSPGEPLKITTPAKKSDKMVTN
eukprot:gene1398-1614_t